jgi:hypothetical protein
MTNTLIELSEVAFAAQYPLRTNHLNPTACWAYGESAGCLFETFGDELAFIRNQNPRTVWTLIDGDDGDQYLLSGIHFVNRLGYLVSTVPVPEGTTIQVRIPMQSDGEAGTAAHRPEPWTNNLDTPWSLRFDRDGTEDIAVICDASGHDLVTSRHFWRPEGDDLAPPALSAVRLMVAAPKLLEALIAASDWIDAHLGEPRTEIQAKVQQAIAEATT